MTSIATASSHVLMWVRRNISRSSRRWFDSSLRSGKCRLLHQAQADVCTAQTVGGPRSAFAIEAKILRVENGLEKFALPLRENEVGRSRRLPLFAKDSGGHGGFHGRVHAKNARRAEPAEKSLKSPLRLPISPSRLDSAIQPDQRFLASYSCHSASKR